MNLIALFTSLRGRIPRKIWWLGYIILTIVSSLATFLIDPTSFTSPSLEAYKPSLAKSLLQLLFLWPMLAITVKRLNDRDQPAWLGYAAALLGLAFFAAPHFGFLRDPRNLGTGDWMFLAPMALIGLWIFIDNGFLKGTPGPNRYGPDPLGPASGSGAGGSVPPIARRPGRTAGAWIRDGIVGGIGCVTALFLLLPLLSMESVLDWAVEEITAPARESMRYFTVREDMRANAPAWKAYTDGREAARSKDYEAAVEHFTRAIELYGPENDTASLPYYHRAYAQRALGRPEDALQSDNDAIRLGPVTDSNYFSRAKSYRALRRYSEALADYDRALDDDQDDGDYHMGRGAMLKELGKTDEALEAYTDAINAAERDYKYWLRFYDEHPDLSSPEEIERLRRERSRIKSWAHVEIGRLMRQSDNADKALEEFNSAISLRPDYRHAYRHRGWLYEKQGRTDKALADYEKAKKLGEPDAWLKKALERVRAKQ